MPHIRWNPKPEARETLNRELAGLCRALGHPARLKLLALLDDCPDRPCGDLVRALPLAQATVSQHLRVLRAVGLVEMRAEGARNRYTLNRPRLSRARTLLAALLPE